MLPVNRYESVAERKKLQTGFRQDVVIEGSFVVKPQFKSAAEFSEGVAHVVIPDPQWRAGVDAYIDPAGKILFVIGSQCRVIWNRNPNSIFIEDEFKLAQLFTYLGSTRSCVASALMCSVDLFPQELCDDLGKVRIIHVPCEYLLVLLLGQGLLHEVSPVALQLQSFCLWAGRSA